MERSIAVFVMGWRIVQGILHSAAFDFGNRSI
jgi:hypothetical protein